MHITVSFVAAALMVVAAVWNVNMAVLVRVADLAPLALFCSSCVSCSW